MSGLTKVTGEGLCIKWSIILKSRKSLWGRGISSFTLELFFLFSFFPFVSPGRMMLPFPASAGMRLLMPLRLGNVSVLVAR